MSCGLGGIELRGGGVGQYALGRVVLDMTEQSGEGNYNCNQRLSLIFFFFFFFLNFQNKL